MYFQIYSVWSNFACASNFAPCRVKLQIFNILRAHKCSTIKSFATKCVQYTICAALPYRVSKF